MPPAADAPKDGESVAGKRFVPGAEIGRGGLGRVVEAWDAKLKRTVAVKLVLDDLPPELRERFLREAELTARLEHPNIVPVHDLLGEGGELRLCMKRVRGRDLATLIAALKRGDAEATKAWSRPRLLRVFQDICLGVAFAHDQGVIHRDLKPSNVMIGDYGETLIVDWGLAKEIGIPETGARAAVERIPIPAPADSKTVRPGSSAMTMEGDVFGTPHYMPPEQAAGRHSEVDTRSDIYSLGAILHELLTLRPPVSGDSLFEVLSNVRAGLISPPGAGPELDAICLKALALRPADRYQSAMQLHDEIQLFLEGVKERERNHLLAEEAVAKARDSIALQKRLKSEAVIAAGEASKQERHDRTKEAKAAYWAAQDRAGRLERETVEAFAVANATLTVALGHEKGHAEARRLKAELFWERFLEAEKSGDEKETLLSRRTVEQYNDGPFDALLKGDGTLTVRTRSYPCRCLLQDRAVPQEELNTMGYHPFSGRPLSRGPDGEGMRELESNAPARLRVHGASCEPAPLAGADVWIWRYEESGRLMVPVTIAGATDGPAAPVDAVFSAASPFRPQGPGMYLGATPVSRRTLPMGSYLIIVARDGFVPVRCPVSIPRCDSWEQEVTLFHPAEIPAGFILVPAGNFGYQGDPGNVHAGDPHVRHVDDFFIARHPVSCQEYCDFLNDLAKSSPAEAAKRVPRESSESGAYWPGPPYAVPTAAWLARQAEVAKAPGKARRLPNTAVDWEEGWPVLGVSWEDGMAFAAWKRSKTGSLVTLPDEVQWEKSARGTDRRFFPFGRHVDEEWCNVNRSHAAGPRPATADEFPHDESPYGVRGLAGNSGDSCMTHPGAEYPGWRISRGGHWSFSASQCRSASRAGNPTRIVYHTYGFRMACACRLSPSK
ncbi:MAG: SUMF1/EgtB/PvdO family nonheme iron enzyme [Planctomycetes bacterium]|nr:SUMF1/EgtB/PvdO family nonheme iron enzyme [Planctomycetota bacterium]